MDFDAATISEKVRDTAPLDGYDFISKYMKFGSKLYPVYHFEGWSDGYNLNAWEEKSGMDTPDEFELEQTSYAFYQTNDRSAYQYEVLSGTIDSVDKTEQVRNGVQSFLNAALDTIGDVVTVAVANTTPPTVGTSDGSTF
jgi:hypothetical protein